MGNPHAVTLVADVDAAPVATLGPQVQANPRFTQGVNVGFLQVVSRSQRALACVRARCGRDAGLLARAPARPWWPVSVSACWTHVWMCRPVAAC